MTTHTHPFTALRVWLGALLLLALLSGMTTQPVQAAGPAKVVYHADFSEPRRFSAMLTNINNMVTHYQNELTDYDVRIVFLAGGVRFVTDDKLTGTPFGEDKALAEQRENLRGRLLSLAKLHNVKLELCDITRSQLNLAPEAIYAEVTLVPSGVVRIAQLQNESGFAYLKVE